ncbi:UDP-N-acetylenolpyruvoylglucosamine reductase [hydrothermal vent metagenome]|uniref:UDP-N-acetylmuramate dehydrogenase n=1 Tax=hydrothermal vent metagenome TaxID=652676 RepID=A0A3B0ZBR6_9ZZZZ
MMPAYNTPELRGKLQEQEPMSRHTTWRVGGPARCFYTPADIDDLSLFLSQTQDESELVWLGLGSNLLVRDGGIAGVVIHTVGVIDSLYLMSDTEVYLGAGATCAKAARFCAAQGLVGAEFLAGIPGTVGGALAMNAGAFGGEIWNSVVKVETINRTGNQFVRSPDEFNIDYRTVQPRFNEWFVGARLELTRGDAENSMRRIKGLLAKRNASQPIGFASCGSVFRNPEGDYAGGLIESCGLKGHRYGGAMVSEKHANFIINTSRASAREIESLITFVQGVVFHQKGVSLIPEVKIIGDTSL